MIATRRGEAGLFLRQARRQTAKVPMRPVTGADDVEIIERISRVLAGQYFSRNAARAAGDDNASVLVERDWVDFQDDAVAVLKTLRAPPESIEGDDADIWANVVKAALGLHATD
jgi:hypothetical protein